LSQSDFDSSGDREAAERLAAELAELRALRKRVEHRRLEDADWAVVSALASKAIEQAEPGQQWVSLELSEEEEALDQRTGAVVGAEDSTPEHRRR
jgi:hypothetical protein